MRVECFLQTRVPLNSKARNIFLGKGAKMYSDKVSEAMILFLHLEYEKNPSCLFGDIPSFLNRKAEIDQKRLGEMTYGAYLDELAKRKGLFKKPTSKRT